MLFNFKRTKLRAACSDMDLKGAQDSFAFLKAAGLLIAVFISDRDRLIAKWIREKEPTASNFFDIWHASKSVTKKWLQVRKESGVRCEVAKGHKEPFALVCYLYQTWIWGADFSKVEVHY